MPAIGFETRLRRLEKELAPHRDRYEVVPYTDDIPPYTGTQVPVYVQIYSRVATDDKEPPDVT